MTQPHIFFEEVNERQGAFHRRAILLGAFAGLGLGALGGRLAYLQLFETQRYEKLSTSNQFNFKLLPAPRGVIVDRNGAILAANRPNFRLMVARDKGVDPEGTLKTLAEYVPLDETRQRRLLREINSAPKRAPVQIAEDMSWEQFSAINVRAPELPGVTADMGEVRVYPHGGAFAHVIGYVAKVNKEDVEKAGPNPDPILLHPSFRIGKQGVEKAFDLDLRGKPGAQKVEVDANGRQVREDRQGDIPATPGKVIELTLDVDVQLRAEEVFGSESGAAVVMDVRNGDILCMFSGPSFDANRFVRGLSGAEYRGLAQYDHKPLFNKALTATYPPGSTFKTMVALAALENGYDPKTVHVCSGHWVFGRVWKCDKVGGHGPLDLRSAVATSCDIYFYQCALWLGPDKIAATARKFGLGEIFDIGIPGQKKGLVPDRAYKARRFPKDPKWHPGETPSMGIGQGYTNLNPLQLCVMTSRIANGTKTLHPRLVRSIGGVEQKSGAAWGELPVDPAHIAFVRDAMAAVTTFGTAAAFGDLGLGGIRMSGKTGTAQAYSYGTGRGVYGTRGAWALRDHAWFIGFAPQDAPRYALAVLVEHGGFGAAAAAPRAREIMRTVLLKDPEIVAQVQRPTPMPDLPPELQNEDGLPDAPDPLPTPGRPAA